MALSTLQKAALAMMPEIVTATNADSFIYAEPFDVAYLIELGYIEQNSTLIEGNKLATRATELGIEFVLKDVQKQPEVAETKKEKVIMSFEIESDVPLPVAKRGGTRTSAYPFDKLEVGQSFFVAPSEKHPQPAKSLASTVSGATKRYDVEVEGTREVRNPKTGETKTVQKTEHTRVFTIRAEVKDGVEGARIFRTK